MKCLLKLTLANLPGFVMLAEPYRYDFALGASMQFSPPPPAIIKVCLNTLY